MIILNVTYTIKPDTTPKAFYDALNAAGIPEACCHEKGNLCYTYSYPADGSHTLMLLEMWTDKDSLKAHQQMPHFKQIAPIKDIYVEQTVFQRSESL